MKAHKLFLHIECLYKIVMRPSKKQWVLFGVGTLALHALHYFMVDKLATPNHSTIVVMSTYNI